MLQTWKLKKLRSWAVSVRSQLRTLRIVWRTSGQCRVWAEFIFAKWNSRAQMHQYPYWQPRQHKADQRDGVFRFTETHLKDQPRPQPTDQRFRRLTRLCFKILALLTSRASIYSLLLLDNGFYSINTITMGQNSLL